MEKILVVLIIILVIMIALLVAITIHNKKKNKVNIDEDLEIEEIDYREEKVFDSEKINHKVERFLDKEELVEEIKPVEEKIDFFEKINTEETLEVNETEEKIENIDIENEVTQIIDLMQVNSKNLVDKVSLYEDEQEENAIISYTELVNAVKSKKEVQEELKFEDFKEPKKEEVVFENNKIESKKFKSSEAISPLGRISKSTSEESYKSDIKNTNMYKNTNNTDDAFLKSLKDFRDNL